MLIDTYPEWSKEWGKKRINPNSNENDIITVRDYLYHMETDEKFIKKLYKMTWDDVLFKSLEWHKKLYLKLQDILKYDGRPEDCEEIIRMGNLQWVSITSEEGLRYEGEAMGHCVGSPNYAEELLENNIMILSLRDEYMKPHVTAEYNIEHKNFIQIQGRGNDKIHKKYKEAIILLLNKFNVQNIPSGLEKSFLNEIVYGELTNGTETKKGFFDILKIQNGRIIQKNGDIFEKIENLLFQKKFSNYFQNNKIIEKDNLIFKNVSWDNLHIVENLCDQYKMEKSEVQLDNNFVFDKNTQKIYNLSDKNIPNIINISSEEKIINLKRQNGNINIIINDNINSYMNSILKIQGNIEDDSLLEVSSILSKLIKKYTKLLNIILPENYGISCNSKLTSFTLFNNFNIPNLIYKEYKIQNVEEIKFPEKIKIISNSEASLSFENVENIIFPEHLNIEAKNLHIEIKNCKNVILPEKIKGCNVKLTLDNVEKIIFQKNMERINSILLYNCNNIECLGDPYFYANVKIIDYDNHKQISENEFKSMSNKNIFKPY